MDTPTQSSETSPVTFPAKAVRIGNHIDLRALPTQDRLATGPVALKLDNGGVAVLLRYGVVVLFNADASAEQRFLGSVLPYVRKPAEQRESEQLNICIDPRSREGVEGDTVTLHRNSVDRLQVIADILGKSVALAVYESQAAAVFDRIEPFATELARTGRGSRQLSRLQRHLGDVLLIEHEMIGRVEVDDKPDMLWEKPELERLHLELHDEFEIHERKLAMERKLQLVSHTAETVAGLIQNARSLRVEWYIVALIVVEIMLWIYEFVGWRG